MDSQVKREYAILSSPTTQLTELQSSMNSLAELGFEFIQIEIDGGVATVVMEKETWS